MKTHTEMFADAYASAQPGTHVVYHIGDLSRDCYTSPGHPVPEHTTELRQTRTYAARLGVPLHMRRIAPKTFEYTARRK